MLLFKEILQVTWMDGVYNSSKSVKLMKQGILFTESSGKRCLSHHNKDVEILESQGEI